MSNPFVAHNRLPFNFVDGISVGGVDLAGPEGSSKIGYKRPETGSVERNIYQKLIEISSFEDLGGVYSDVIDQTAVFLNAINSVKHLVIFGNIAVVPPLSIPSNKTVEFCNGAKIIALTTGPHILGCEPSAQNITIINPEVDGQNIRGLNGFGFDTAKELIPAKNIRVINPIARNCKRSPTTGGGRGFTVQKNTNSIQFINARAFNCTTAADLNGSDILGSVVGFAIDMLYAEDCQEVISVYGDGTNSNATIPPVLATNSTATIGQVFARNCGRTTDTILYSGTTTPSDLDGGVIVSRRGRNVSINNLYVYNDPDYTIGAFFRGTGNNIVINNFEFFGNVQAVCVVGSAENLLPLTAANDASYGIKIRGSFHGSATNIIDSRISTGSDYLTGFDIDVSVDSFSTTNTLLQTLSVFRNDSRAIIRNIAQGTVIEGGFLDIFTYVNAFALATSRDNLCSSIKTYSAQINEGTLTQNGDLNIGSLARVNFTSTSAGAGAAAGYVLIKVNGVTKKIQYFDV
jgi:hypothetical protein